MSPFFNVNASDFVNDILLFREATTTNRLRSNTDFITGIGEFFGWDEMDVVVPHCKYKERALFLKSFCPWFQIILRKTPCCLNSPYNLAKVYKQFHLK